MKIWIFFHGPVEPDYPEAGCCMKIRDEAVKRGFDAVILNPDNIDLLIDSEGDWKAIHDGQVLDMPDIIIPRTGSSTTYTGYSVMRFYERLGVTFLNTPRVIETVSDKLHTMQVLAAHNLPVPRTILGKFPSDIDMIEAHIGFPVVIKSLAGTHGKGVILAENKDKFRDLTDLIADTNTNKHFLFQSYIANSYGRDLRVFVVDGKVTACMERKSQSDTFKANLSRGGNAAAYPITPEIEKLALAIAKQLRLDVTGIDLLFDKDGFVVCEANSAPRFDGVGRMDDVCNTQSEKDILNAALRKYREKNNKGLFGFFGFSRQKKHGSAARGWSKGSRTAVNS